MRRGIQSVVGASIRRVERPASARKPILIAPDFPKLRRRMTGKAIEAVDRVGKRVVLRLAGGDALVIEPRMTGLVLLSDPPSAEHLRLRIELDRAPGELLFWDRRGLGVIRLLTPVEFASRLGADKLGPDALELSAEALAERLSASRRAIKVALLDQRALAGVGNLYASEILHLAGLHPGMRCDKLRREDWPRLHEAMQAVLRLAIEHEGSTLGDGTYRNALNQSGGYQNHHCVYARADEMCPTCGRHAVQRIVQAQRSTFFCLGCQPKRRGGMV
jgi:formamidopyrimidine-DNA glycosylase